MRPLPVRANGFNVGDLDADAVVAGRLRLDGDPLGDDGQSDVHLIVNGHDDILV